MADLRRLESIAAVLREGTFRTADETFTLLVCPTCSIQFNHVGDSIRQAGQDDYQAWQGRGDLIVVPVTGECGSEWDICFGFHKGESHVFARVRKACTDTSYLYFIEAVGTGFIKIGRSADPDARVRQLSTGSPNDLRILGRLGGGSALEAELHQRFDSLRERGEWFKGTDELRAFIARSTV